MTNQSSKVLYFDSLRALATIAVIVIHVSSPLVNMTWTKNMPYWWFGIIIDASVRFAVPIFIMLTGATLLGREIKLLDFYKRRVIRVLIPFLFWMLVYWIYRWIMLAPTARPDSFQNCISWAINLFLKEGISKHFWYIYMIIFIYIGLPFLSSLVRKLNQKQLLVLILCWWALTIFGQELPFNAYSWDGFYGSKFTGYLLYSGYLLLGFYLSKIEMKMKKLPLFAVYIASIAIAALFVYSDSVDSNRLNLSIYSYISSNTIMQSAAIFMLLKNIDLQNKIVHKTQNVISNYSFGIYLVHIIFIEVLFRNGIYWSLAHPVISVTLLTFVVLISSMITIFILRKIPFGKYISG